LEGTVVFKNVARFALPLRLSLVLISTYETVGNKAKGHK
jgi:hypothetical protein